MPTFEQVLKGEAKPKVAKAKPRAPAVPFDDFLASLSGTQKAEAAKPKAEKAPKPKTEATKPTAEDKPAGEVQDV